MLMNILQGMPIGNEKDKLLFGVIDQWDETKRTGTWKELSAMVGDYLTKMNVPIEKLMEKILSRYKQCQL